MTPRTDTHYPLGNQLRDGESPGRSRFKDAFWNHETKLTLKTGKKAEQQAPAKYGLDYVTDTYLPEEL